MKKLIFVFFAGVFFASCSEKDVTAPGAANQNVFFKNANVEVENFSVSQTSASSVDVSFSTTYENNIQRIELMSSADASTFCVVTGVSTTTAAKQAQTYALADAKAKAQTMYYMLRFEDNAGNWTYSNYSTIKLN